MTFDMNCDFIQSKFTGIKSISTDDVDIFKIQLKEIMKESENIEGIIYIWRTITDIPRLRGKSEIIYIGRTKNSFYSRYISKIDNEIKYFWDKYKYIVKEYGEITVDIYKTENPEQTENNFLYQYKQEFLELPPLNSKSYNEKLLNKF